MNSNATGIDAEAPLAPVSAGERIQTMDVLRGGALFGILWMNTPTNGEPVSGLDRGVLLVGNVLADGKFLALYSFLFGLGFAVQLLRAEQRGAAVVPLYLRRLAVLLLIGLAHGIFLWHGDILQFYAVAGLVLLALRDVRPRLVLILAGLCLVLQVFSGELSDGINALRRLEPEAARVEALREEVRDLDHRAIAQRVVAAEEYGTYWNLVSARAVQETAAYWPLDSNLGEWSDGVVLCMFLLGLYSGRRGIFQDPAAHLRFLRRVMWWGLGIGLASNVATAMAMAQDDERWVNGALYAVGRPALCLFYAAVVTVLMQDLRWRSRLGILSWAGRMGLTNYLLQSLIFTTVFYGYGLGWSAKSSSTRALVFAVVVFAAQTWWSKWWMQRFQYGPMEWLWRSLTYGKRQPMRVVRA